MQLVDKAFFLVSKVIDLLVEDVVHPGTGDQPAAILYSEGRRSLDPRQWDAFLEAANNLMRSKDREDVWKPVAIVHDRQNTLPKERIAQLIAMVSEPGHAAAGHALTS